MRILILFILCSLFSIKLLKAGEWYLVDDYRASNDLQGQMRYAPYATCIDCYDKNHCIMFANMGWSNPCNRFTSDGGKTWRTTLQDSVLFDYDKDSNRYEIYHPCRVADVKYVDSTLCLAFADSGYIWKSKDGCKTWSKKNIYGEKPKSETSYLEFYKMNLFNHELAAVITPGDIYLSTDLGESWEKSIIILPDNITPLCYEDISLPEKDVIITIGWKLEVNEYIIRSDDGGKNWEAFPPPSHRFKGIYFLNKNEGWAAGRIQVEPYSSIHRDIILHTTNGGKAWEVQLDTLLSPKNGLNKIHFFDVLNGIAWGYNNKIWRTNDGGKYWFRVTSFSVEKFNGELADISPVSPNEIYGIIGDQSKIYKYTDEILNVENSYSIENSINNLNIFPNPINSNDAFNLSFELMDACEISINLYNVLGEKIDTGYQGYLNHGLQKLSYKPDSNLPAGTYCLVISNESERVVKMVVVMN
jgi:photosystem II stability/assembly factor-like uncharacterized protein